MARENIDKYAAECAEDNMVVPIDHPFDEVDYNDYMEAYIKTFKMGVEYADSHPKSPWISVEEDLPCNHDELWVMTGRLIHTKKVLVALIDGTVRLLSMLYDEVNDKWEWESKILKDKIIFWTPIPELPKE